MGLIPLWFVLGAVTVLLWGTSMFFGKIGADRIPGTSVKVYLYVGGVFSTAYAFGLSGFRIEPHLVSGAMGVVAGLCTAFANLFLYIALNRGGTASVLVPLSNLYPMVTVVLAFALLNERPSITQCLGVLLSIAAVMLLG